TLSLHDALPIWAASRKFTTPLTTDQKPVGSFFRQDGRTMPEVGNCGTGSVNGILRLVSDGKPSPPSPAMKTGSPCSKDTWTISAGDRTIPISPTQSSYSTR